MKEKSDFKIRKIIPSDNQDVAALIRDNLKNCGLDIPGTAYFDSMLDNLYEFYSYDKRDYYVLTDKDDNVVGGIGFAEFMPFENCAELQKLYLNDRVKGLGMGYILISFIENKITEAGYKAVYLETHSCLRAAIHIYEKSGYSKIERHGETAHGAMDCFYYKDLL